MKRKNTKKLMSLALSLLMIISVVPFSLVARAATTQVYSLQLPRGDDSNKNGWGHSALSFMNGWHNSSVTSNAAVYSLDSYTGKTAYCIEPGVSLYSGESLSQKGEDYWTNYPNNLNNAINADFIKSFIGRIMQYGWTGYNDVDWNSGNSSDANEMANLLATQYLIWEVIVGERDESFNKINASTQGKNNILDLLSSSHPLYSKIMSYYNSIVSSVISHTKIPSFMKSSAAVSAVHNMTWNGSAYSVSLTDTNGVLSNYSFNATGGVTCSVNGNVLTLSSLIAPSGDVTITARKNNSKKRGVVVWSDGVVSNTNNSGQIQDVVTYSAEVDDPVTAYVMARVENGSMSIIKTTQNNDGIVSGFKFEVRNSSNVLIGTYTTDSTGKIDVLNLSAGMYSVKEIDLSSDFVEPSPNPKSVTVVAGQTVSISFDNIKKRGVITVRKSDSLTGAVLANAVFEIYSGSTLVDTVTTNSSGTATSSVLPLGSYTLKEKTAPSGYKLNTSSFSVTLNGLQGDDAIVYAPQVGITNTPQTGYITVKKTNANTSMGDYSLAGAVFEIYSGSTLVDTITTNSTGEAQSKALALGTYTIKEKTAPTGYVLNTNSFSVTLSYAGQSEAFAYASVTVPNYPQTGVIRISKTNANTSMGDYSLAGAVFEIYSGSTLVDTMTTNSSGVAQSKQLPLGSYTVKEKTAPNGFLLNTNTFTAMLSYAGQTADITYTDVSVQETPQTGKINIKKTNSNSTMGDYDLSGAVFEIYNSSGAFVDTVTTNSNGEAQSKALKLGTYTVKEKTAPYGFVLNTASYTATLSYAGQTETYAYTTVTIPEIPQTGIIRVAKTNANVSMGDYSLAGAVFEVYSGGVLLDTITTDSKGEAKTKELPLGAYTIKEKTAPYGYVLNTQVYNASLTYAGQTVTVTYSDTTIPEQPQVGTITLTKQDKATGSIAQGDSTLVGAVFEVYDSKKTTLVDTIYCGSDVKATTKELPLGTYFVREKTPPVGYNHDDTFYEVKIEYAGQNVSVAKVNSSVKNKVIEGQIAFFKHTDQPDDSVNPSNSQVEQPLEGAVFQVYLKSAGSYDKAKTTERDLLTTDENGYAITKMLPYGVYTVKEISAPGDYKLVDAFDVFISAEGKVYRYILNNPTFSSLVKIIKIDSETGKTIHTMGTSFKVKDLSTGEWVSQSYNYPTPTMIDIFETAADGTLVMPEALVSGDYELYEIQAPYGYVLASSPEKFTIHSSQATPEILEVKMKNTPTKGVISVEKQGNMLTGVQIVDTTYGKQYVPVFELAYLEGAVFNIIAAEDIITPDGTVRYAKGEIIDTVTTSKNGKAQSKQLYLGNYEVVEITAPHGFVLDETVHTVSLMYENQELAVVSSQVSVTDIRGQVEIELQKLMEKPVNANEDFNAFADVIFGLYANEDILGIDGSILIPKDNLVALSLVIYMIIFFSKQERNK